MGCRVMGMVPVAVRQESRCFTPSVTVTELSYATGPPPILPSALMGWEPGKSCSQQSSKPSWSREYSPLWGGEEAWGKIPPDFAGSVTQGV